MQYLLLTLIFAGLSGVDWMEILAPGILQTLIQRLHPVQRLLVLIKPYVSASTEKSPHLSAIIEV